MRVLLLSFYYEPDIGPGAFRSQAWAQAVARRFQPGDALDVITTEPNRYASFAPVAPATEHDGAITVVRIKLPTHRSGFVDQSRAFLRFAWAVWRLAHRRQYDLVCATSSRLMTAFLGAVIARRQRAPLFLDIRDLFVDAIGDVLRGRGALLMPLFRAIERFTFGQAQRINLVSEGFVEHVRRRHPDKPLSVVTNGIDDAFLQADFRPVPRAPGVPLRVLYAGNIGDGQGLHAIVPALARATTHSHEFWIVGDGGARIALEQAVRGLSNVHLLRPVDRAALIDLYRGCDVLFLHLNDLPAFRKVLPSKLFEYAATGKPMLAGVAGHAAEFLSAVPGVAVFPPCDGVAAVRALAQLPKGVVDRRAFVQTHTRRALMERLAQEALATARRPGPSAG